MIDQNVVFYGNLSELYRLAKEGKIKTTLQGSHTRPCKFWTATKILSGIKNAIVISHGPSGCAYGVKRAYKLTNSRAIPTNQVNICHFYNFWRVK